MARVLVTGGTGFIGRHLVRRLVERGDQVRCLIRDPRRARLLAPFAVEAAAGDITEPASLPPALAGIDIVYHLAAATLVARTRLYRTLNDAGTHNIAQACARQPHPPTVVYVSSLAAAGPAPLDHPLTETCHPAPISEYGRTKLAGERRLRAVADCVPITVLRPPSVVGPGDHYTLKIFRMARHGFSLIPGTQVFQLSWIYVADLVDAIVRAGERGLRLTTTPDDEQGVYFVALDDLPTATDIAHLAARIEGRSSVRIIHIPAGLARFTAQFNALRTRLTGRTYWINPDKIQEALAGSWTCTPAKARREIGFACQTNLFDAFRLISEWGHEQGFL